MEIRIAQIAPSTMAEGPGNRFALWVQGCSIRCKECCNPHMFKSTGGTLTTVQDIVEQIKSTLNIEGISILGGEPFDQPSQVLELCKQVKGLGLSVMVYSGYTIAEIKDKLAARQNEIHDYIDLLVDGRYDYTKPEPSRRWIGSSNQNMHFLSDRYNPTDPQFSLSNTVEVLWDKKSKTITVNGFPHEKFVQLKKKGEYNVSNI